MASTKGAQLTDLEIMYADLRRDGKTGHYKALRVMARRTGIDKATVERCLKRARRADMLDAKRES